LSGPWRLRIEEQTGVDRYVVLAVWGMETNFGSFTGNTPVIRALSSLAFARYRGDYFKKELLVALQILQEGHVGLNEFKGSWAGAMGQTQFMPTSFQRFAVDFDRDGRKNIWTNVADALGSTGHYLEKNGWVRGATWGYEVIVPNGFDFSQVNSTKTFGDFARQGVRRADGDPMPVEPAATLVAPAGENGPVFLLSDNFKVIRRYNNALSYGLGVALLSDRIAGAPALTRPWPNQQEASR
jgi:lytic murein transglycosylase